MLGDVKAFRVRFMLGCPQEPQLLQPEAYELRQTLLNEELQEFTDAHKAGDLVEAADALVDLVYVALGTAIEMGLPFQELWNDVHRANMDKVRCSSDDESKRGSSYDVRKPEGWTPPQGRKIIARATAKALVAKHSNGYPKQSLLSGLEEFLHEEE